MESAGGHDALFQAGYRAEQVRAGLALHGGVGGVLPGGAGGGGDCFGKRAQCSHPAGEPLLGNHHPGYHLTGGAALRRGEGKDDFHGGDLRRGDLHRDSCGHGG